MEPKVKTKTNELDDLIAACGRAVATTEALATLLRVADGQDPDIAMVHRHAVDLLFLKERLIARKEAACR